MKCDALKSDREKNIGYKNKKILLALLPFWTPLIPPMGIACLKGFLQRNGCDAKTYDANTQGEFKDLYNRYFEILRRHVPEHRQGNFFSIGHDVLQNHMMAYLNYKNEREYIDVVKMVLFGTFYCRTDDHQVMELNRVIADYYRQLHRWLSDVLDNEKPDLLGFSVNSTTLPSSLFAFKAAKQKYPDILTVMGGGIFSDHLAPGTPNFKILLEKTKSYIDKIILGEGEILFFKLLCGELPESQRVFSLEDIKAQTLDLSVEHLPDFRDFNLQHYPYLSAYASRSCPFHCSFCSDSVMWGKYRKKSPKQVARELIKLSETYQYQLFMLSDLLLNPILDKLAEELINSEHTIYWDGCLRVDKNACKIENTLKWRRGGFYRARLGIESGSAHVLELMGKSITLQQVKEAVSCLAYAGIQTTTLWVIGHPGETETDFQQTLAMIEELKNDIYEAECRPFYYYLTGQVGSDRWAQEYNRVPLYPNAENLLLFQSWTLDCLPSREETYERVNRFVQHCSRLGIPNIYSLHDTYNADQRWIKNHKNAVPSLMEFKKRDAAVRECRDVENVFFIRDKVNEVKEGNFAF